MVGRDIQGPLGGEILNFPPLQTPPPGCELSLTARLRISEISRCLLREQADRAWDGRQDGFPNPPTLRVTSQENTIDAHVGGTREGFHYEVYYLLVNKRENTHVYVLVYRDLAIGDDSP